MLAPKTGVALLTMGVVDNEPPPKTGFVPPNNVGIVVAGDDVLNKLPGLLFPPVPPKILVVVAVVTAAVEDGKILDNFGGASGDFCCNKLVNVGDDDDKL